MSDFKTQRAAEVLQCALTALIPLMDGDARNAAALLKIQQRRIHNQEVSSVLTDIAEIAPVMRDAALADRAGVDTNDEMLEMIGRRTLGAPHVNVWNDMTTETANGFCYALAAVTSDKSHIKNKHLGKCADSSRAVRAMTNRVPTEMRQDIENAAKLIDAAAIIASSEELINAQQAIERLGQRRG